MNRFTVILKSGKEFSFDALEAEVSVYDITHRLDEFTWVGAANHKPLYINPTEVAAIYYEKLDEHAKEGRYAVQSELIYPITIAFHRYGGAYSGGIYTAWNLLPENVPKEIDGSDSECMDFWSANKTLCGKGDTPNAAVASLLTKIARKE